MQKQTAQQLLFQNLVDQDIIVKRTDVQITSDAGPIPVRECITDQRSRCAHSVNEMLRQRLFGILADYEDCNDHDDLRNGLSMDRLSCHRFMANFCHTRMPITCSTRFATVKMFQPNCEMLSRPDGEPG